jgi:hypothetical protein
MQMKKRVIAMGLEHRLTDTLSVLPPVRGGFLILQEVSGSLQCN